MSLELRPARPEDAAQLASMTYPAYRHLLSLDAGVRHPGMAHQILIQPHGVVAERNGEICGLVLLAIPTDGDEAELLSVFVARPWRGQGLSLRLLDGARAAAAAQGCSKLAGIYTQGAKGHDWFAHVSAAQGWSRPKLSSLTLKFNLASMTLAKWFGSRPLAEGEELRPWLELSAHEHDELRASQAADNWIPEPLLPWNFPLEQLIPESSYWFLDQGRVRGWILNDRLSDELVRVTNSYMEPGAAKVGKTVPLWTQSIDRTMEVGFRNCTFVTMPRFPRMALWARRRFAPNAYFVGESMYTAIALEKERKPQS